MTEWIDSPCKREGKPGKAAKGRKLALKAAEWIEQNPDKFRQLAFIAAHSRKDHLRDRVSIKCQEQGIYITDPNQPGVNMAHALFSPLMRYAQLLYPEKEFILRESCVDYSGLPAIESFPEFSVKI